jgi:hypothetical protein
MFHREAELATGQWIGKAPLLLLKDVGQDVLTASFEMGKISESLKKNIEDFFQQIRAV